MINNKKSFFWISYADLMTSLFFIMLVLFVLTVIAMHNKEKATREEIDRIHSIENSIKAIDPRYFTYDSVYKKHTLNIDVQFNTYSFSMNDIRDKQAALIAAGNSIKNFMDTVQRKNPGTQYLLVIEGQTSRDYYWRDEYHNNDVLSYQRARALKNFWENNGVRFGSECEVIVGGSGQDGVLRFKPDNRYNFKNQRFSIHIIPKPGSF